MVLNRHLVYAEDIIFKLMQHPDNMLFKHKIRELINEVISEKEVTVDQLLPSCSWSDTDSDGDIYD